MQSWKWLIADGNGEMDIHSFVFPAKNFGFKVKSLSVYIFFKKMHFLKCMTADLESNLHSTGDNGKTPIDFNRSGLHPQRGK